MLILVSEPSVISLARNCPCLICFERLKTNSFGNWGQGGLKTPLCACAFLLVPTGELSSSPTASSFLLLRGCD